MGLNWIPLFATWVPTPLSEFQRKKRSFRKESLASTPESSASNAGAFPKIQVNTHKSETNNQMIIAHYNM